MNEFNENQSGSGNGLVSIILLVIIALLAYQIYRMESIFKLLTQDGIEVAAPAGVTRGSDKKNEAPALGDNKASDEASAPKQAQSNDNNRQESTKSETNKWSFPKSKRKTASYIEVSTKGKAENRYIERNWDRPITKDGITGVVVLNVVIKNIGEITKVSLNPASTITDEDIIDSCKECALKTRFSSNYDCPDRQTGTITYTFAERVIE